MSEDQHPEQGHDEPLMSPTTDTPRFQPDPPSGWAVFFGVLAGLLVGFVFPLILMNPLDRIFGGLPTVGFWLVALFPGILGVVVLLVPAWRRAGAGFVLGLAIGTIVFAGICATILNSLP